MRRRKGEIAAYEIVVLAREKQEGREHARHMTTKMLYGKKPVSAGRSV